MLASLADITDGFAVDQLTHSLQTATRAEEAGADDEVVVAALCHDIGKSVSVLNHPKIAAEILRPYVRPEVFSDDRGASGLPGPALLRIHEPGPQRPRSSTVVRRGSLLPNSSPTIGIRSASIRTTRPSRSSTSSPWCARSSAGRTASKASATRWPASLIASRPRLEALQRLVIDLGRRDFDKEYPNLKLTPVVALICAFDEADNIGAVLSVVPAEVMGLAVTPVVVVDGGDDGTDTVAVTPVR